MRLRSIHLNVVGLCLILIGCGASQGQSKADAEDVSAYDALAGLPEAIDIELASVNAPIAGVDVLLAQSQSIPATHQIDSETMSAVVSSGMEGELKVPTTMSAKAKAELTAFVDNVVTLRDGLEAVSTRALSAAKTVTMHRISAPILAAQANTKARIVVANPFSSPLEKTQASEQQSNIPLLETEVQTRVAKAQAALETLPAEATTAMGKLVAGLRGIGLTPGAMAALQKPVSDAQAATEDAKHAVEEAAKEAANEAAREAAQEVRLSALSAYDELKGIPAAVQAARTRLEAPIAQVEGLLAQAQALRATHQLDAENINAALASALAGQEVVVPAGLNAPAQTALQTFATTLATLKSEFDALPGRVKTAAQSTPQFLATALVLAAQARTQAAIVLANRFATDAQKTAAQTQQAGIEALQVAVKKKVVETQRALSALPMQSAMAVGRLVTGLVAQGIQKEVVASLEAPRKALEAAAASAIPRIAAVGVTPLSAYDELKGIPQRIDAEFARLHAPLAAVERVIKQAQTLTQTHTLDAQTLNLVVLAALGQVGVQMPETVPIQAQRDLTGLAQQMVALQSDLGAFDARTQAMVQTLATQFAAVVTLGTQAQAQAKLVIANQLASETQKAVAEQQKETIEPLQAAAKARIAQAKQDLQGLPAQAMKAAERFGQGLTGLGLSPETIAAIRDAQATATAVQKDVETTVDAAGQAVGVENAADKSKAAAKGAIEDQTRPSK